MAEIRIEDIKPNSHKYRAEQQNKKESKTVEERHLTPVVKKAELVSTKKSLGTKLKETFFGADIKDAKSYLIHDILIPGAKDAALDFLSMLFFNQSYRGKGGYYGNNRSYYGTPSYRNYSSNYRSGNVYNQQNQNPNNRPENIYMSNEKVDYKSIVVRERMQAENICNQLWEQIDMYQSASVANLLDLIDVSPKFTDHNWGWTNPNEIGMKRVPGGYLIDVADAHPID